MPRPARFVGPLTALILAGACTPARPVVHSAPVAQHAPTEVAAAAYLAAGETLELRSGSDRHVVVVSIDGLRPDAIDRFDAHTLQRLIGEGTSSLEAQTIEPSITLPSHTSMLTGAGPEVHGITWNNNRVADRGRVAIHTIFRAAHEQGLTTAAFASKGKFNHLFDPADLDYFVVPEGNGSWSADRTAGNVDAYLQEHRPNLLFVHFREPDRWGHIFGWMGWVYGWAVREADEGLAEVIESADRAFGSGGYTLIVTADHGGDGHDHGDASELDRTIPWIAWGRGVEAGATLPAGIHTTDTAATALWLLGLPAPETVTGRPVRDAFDAGFLALDRDDRRTAAATAAAAGEAESPAVSGAVH